MKYMRGKTGKVLAIGVAMIASTIIVATYVSVERSRVADSAWNWLHADAIAYRLDPTAERALEIANYYFNWYGDGAYDLEKAKFYYREALKRDPHINTPWYQLARIDFLEGKFRSAIYKVNKQIALHSDPADPFYDRAHYVRGLTYGYIGRYKRAEADFLGLIERHGDHSHWAYYVDLGWFYFSEGKFEALKEVSLTGVRHYPDNPWVLSNLGLAHLNLEEYDEAERVLNFALREANKLSIDDWQSAYPGNDPALADQGLREMIAAIEGNVALAVDNMSTVE